MKTNTWFIKGVLVAALVVLGAANAAAQVAPPDSDFKVIQNEDGITLTIDDYTGSAKDIRIPAKLYGLPVTNIGNAVFAQRGLTGVVIPDSVTWIWFNAFANNRLTSITITIGGNLDGTGFDESFIRYYNGLGRKPGTYVKNGPFWSMK